MYHGEKALVNMEDSGMGKAIIDTSIKVKTGFRKEALKETFEERIHIIMDTILENVDRRCLKKIYLFGSYAYGRPHKDSDIDICIVFTDDTDDNEAYLKFAVPLYDKGLMPLDLLVYHESDFYNFKNPRGIENTIITRGRLLYG
jgi:predicted nucleotidyltransferase